MRNFVVFFDEKEGTSPLMRLLDAFEGISVLHQEGDKGWEPFDYHNCGPLSVGDLGACLDMVYGDAPVDMDRLNAVYGKTAPRRLAAFDANTSVGFKMRFFAPGMSLPFERFAAPLRQVSRQVLQKSFQKMMIDTLKRHNVVVFMAVRQDVFRWGLSKYHGDGTGKKGHLQFKLASGKIDHSDIPAIRVDTTKLDRTIRKCEDIHAQKRRIVETLNDEGIETCPIRYEQFLSDKPGLFREIAARLETGTDDAEIERVLSAGTMFKKVHSDDISDFVINHEEITERFANRFVAW